MCVYVVNSFGDQRTNLKLLTHMFHPWSLFDWGSGLPTKYEKHSKDFVDTLDYILFDTTHFTQSEILNVPTSFKKLNKSRVQNGHLLPSNIWPSDHIAIGTRLSFKKGELDDDDDKKEGPLEESSDKHKDTEKEAQGTSSNTKKYTSYHDYDEADAAAVKTPDNETMGDSDVPLCGVINGDGLGPPPPPILPDNETMSDSDIPLCGVINGDGLGSPPPILPSPPMGLFLPQASPVKGEVPTDNPTSHGQRCDCGCVPPVLSLFEMAELRRKAREAKKLQQQQRHQYEEEEEADY